MSDLKISILISTKNRCEDLLFTLSKIKHLLNQNVTCVVFDDGSNDQTTQKVKSEFPQITLRQNQISKGYIYCRNMMLNETQADYTISLDDDAHFLIENPIEIITDHFQKNPNCGLIAARIFWGKETPENTKSLEKVQTVKSYVGCGHIWRMKAWRDIPNYPEWFQFYGEENFASLQLFKKKWEIHYVPELFVQHRVHLKNRTQINNDFAFRHRRSLRADWYNYFLFFPINKVPRKLMYSVWMQIRNKIFKGNFKIIPPLFLALLDLLITFPNLMKHRNSLNSYEYHEYSKLNEVKVYWDPKKAKP
jgi:glycosyltransferase involved in cell wall biosynthesis